MKMENWEEIPSDWELNYAQRVQIKANIQNLTHVDKAGISEFLQKLEYPLHFLDFETVNPALPIYPKSKPFQHIPFLYYLFTIEKEGAEAKEFYYIEEEGKDPREEMVKRLTKESIQKTR